MSNLKPQAAAAVWVPKDDWGRRFDAAWDTLKERFFKCEAQQFYDEGPNSALDDFLAQNYEALVEKLVAGRKEDAPFYEQARSRGTDFVRIHVVAAPLSDYVRHELYSYVLSERLGERILLIEENVAQEIAGGPVADFQIFDQSVLFIQDIQNNEFRGALASTDPGDIRAALTLANQLVQAARPFRDVCPIDSSLERRLLDAFE